MGSLTVRNLKESVKKRLRLRAAANGRSMEEEVRLLLAEGAAETAAAKADATRKPSRKSDRPLPEATTRRVLLIISGGIAAYKSLDLIRRLRAPAMNPRMWANQATQRNLKQLIADGVVTVGPNAGEMAESGEAGVGRMVEPLEIVAAIEKLLDNREAAQEKPPTKPLAGKHI